jgi:hypothetical protein
VIRVKYPSRRLTPDDVGVGALLEHPTRAAAAASAKIIAA